MSEQTHAHKCRLQWNSARFSYLAFQFTIVACKTVVYCYCYCTPAPCCPLRSGNTPARSCFEVFASDLDLMCKSRLCFSLVAPIPDWATCCVGIGLGIGGSSSTTHPNAWELRRPCFEVAWKRLFAEFEMRTKKLCANTRVCAVLPAVCVCVSVSGKKLNYHRSMAIIRKYDII